MVGFQRFGFLVERYRECLLVFRHLGIKPHSIILCLFYEPLRQCFQVRHAFLASPVEFRHFWTKSPLYRRRVVPRNKLPLNSRECPSYFYRVRGILSVGDIDSVITSLSLAVDGHI